MKPCERIREFRKKNKLRQKQFAQLLGYSQGYVAEIEKGKREPSRDFLIKLNSVFGLSSDYILYGERKRPENLEKYGYEGLMPIKFIQRLKKDLENLTNPEDFYSTLNISKEIINEVLEGKLILKREFIIELAQKLNQPVHEYLLLAQYVPDEILKFTDHPGLVDFFKQIGMLSPGETEEVLQTISVVIRPYVKKYGLKKD